MANTPVFELLERNQNIFENRDVVIAGDLLDPMILSLVKNSKSAVLICDNYVTCQSMAAMIGQTMDDTCPQVISYKHVKLIFADVDFAMENIDTVNTLVLLLSKSKQQTQKILNTVKPKLEKEAFVYTAGSNDGGAKSADSLLKPMGRTQKIDLARKCTLFKAFYEQDFNTYKKPSDISIDILDNTLTLKQDVAVFSQGKLDAGTQMLLTAVKDVVPQGAALDLGCGCGVVGITLSKLGFKNITCSDVSAAALTLTATNAKLNGCESIKTKAADMLQGQDKYDFIIVNPPFHVGILTTLAPAVNMIISAKDHLTKNGVFYMVANAHLGYYEVLLENFSQVQIVASSTKFIVYKASIN